MSEETPSVGTKRSNFFYWYCNEAIHDLLEIWKNFMLFSWRYFSIGELFLTLFSPWHRDVLIDGRRGFNPLRLLEILFENFISRLIGAIVRIVVIFSGLLVFLLVFLTGIIASFLWLSAPLFFVGFLVLILIGKANLFAGLAILLWILIFVSCYFRAAAVSLFEMNIEKLSKRKVFERICGRLGLARKNFPTEILENQEMLADFLKVRGVTIEEYAKIIHWELSNLQKKEDDAKFWQWQQLKKITPIGTQWRYGYTVNLDRYANNLSEADLSSYGEEVLIGRSGENELLKLILTRPDQNCALIVGNAGIGKKTLVHCLAREIRTGQEEVAFRNMRIMLLDLSRAISDAVNQGINIESRLQTIFQEAIAAGNVILVIEHIEHFLGGEENMLHPDVSTILIKFLALPSFRLISTSTSAEYHQLIEKKQQIVKYFETVEMGEPTEEETIQIMLRQLEKYESKRVLFSYVALREIVRSSSRHNWSSPLPERAIDLMMDVLMFWNKNSQQQFVTEKELDEFLSLKTGVKQGEIGNVERKKLLNLENVLHRHVIGQQKAVSQVAEALRRSRSGIGDLQKPVGSFLFLGPTGVGKTETAKALAKVYFGNEKHVIRLDMSEFQTPSSIDRLLGSSQLNQQGRLVTQIKDNPYSLLLLDEIEKAYPDILDIFLQILDEGFVTDAFGEKINFRNCIIIATSNAGAVLIKKMVEENASPEEIQKAVIDWTVESNIFKVEFLNRFDGVIFFRPLQQKELVGVVGLKLREFADRLDREKNIQVDFDENIIEKIIQKGYNPIFGARSINRYIEETVENLVAQKIIKGQASNGEKIKIEL
jgi:ATP-dependent Clp protease ATP-binding subunit ClpA